MTELNKDKRKIVIKDLVKFIIQNIEKYNRIYFEKKWKKNKRGKVINNFEEMFKII